MQQVMKAAFADAGKSLAVDTDAVVSTVQQILSEKDLDFRENLNRLDNQKERRVLFCIASEGLATSLRLLL